MFQLSKTADYGMVIAVHFAQLAPGTLCNAKGIAESLGLSRPMVAKILKILVQAKLLSSIQGSKGGYVLHKSPKDVSVLNLIESLDETVAVTECSHENAGKCLIESKCKLKQPWIKINQALRDTLARLSLEDMKAGSTGAPMPHLPSFQNTQEERLFI